MKDVVRKFLVDNRADPDAGDFTDDESLLEKGVIDSVMMVDLITFLESECGVRIEDDEMTPENFDSVTAIVAFVAGKAG